MGAGRALKSKSNIPDGKKVAFYIQAKAADAEFLRGDLASLERLLNASGVEISEADYDTGKSGAAPHRVCSSGTIFLPLAGLVDADAERARLEKQYRELEGWIKGARARLGNEKFRANAPAQVVADAEAKLREMLDKQSRVSELLAALK